MAITLVIFGLRLLELLLHLDQGFPQALPAGVKAAALVRMRPAMLPGLHLFRSPPAGLSAADAANLVDPAISQLLDSIQVLLLSSQPVGVLHHSLAELHLALGRHPFSRLNLLLDQHLPGCRPAAHDTCGFLGTGDALDQPRSI